MKDSASSQTLDVHREKQHDTNSSENPSNLLKTPSQSEQLNLIRDVVSRYVGQLLYGCGNSTCTEQLCYTGSRNTSQRPVRRYTPRSARAIALAIASGPKPRNHICPRYTHDTEANHEAGPEGPRDPTSFAQRMSDSPSIRGVCSSLINTKPEWSSSLSISGPQENDHVRDRLTHWHAVLDEMSRSSVYIAGSTRAKIEECFTANDDIASRLYDCLYWLLSRLPRGNEVQWKYVGKIIDAGCAYPPQNQNDPYDPRHNNWLDILDALEHAPSLNLLYHLLSVVGERNKLELDLWRALDTSEQSRVRVATSRKNRQWILTELAKKTQEGPISEIGKRGLIVWLKKMFLRHWDGEVRMAEGTVAWTAMTFLGCIYTCGVISVPFINPHAEWYTLPIVPARVDAIEMARTWMQRESYRVSSAYGDSHILRDNCFFTINQYATYFRMINHLRMRQIDSEAEMAFANRARYERLTSNIDADVRLKHLEERYLLLSVSRRRVLRDAFDQLWRRRRSELLRPLRVRLGEREGLEVGHDLGGVQIEFFNLVCKELFSESAQMFTTDATTGLSYFHPGSLQPLYMFQLCGLLFAIAIFNGISLPVNLPHVFYLILSDRPFNHVSAIADGWPVIKKSLEDILNEDIPGLDATFPLEANGVRLTVKAHKELEKIGSPWQEIERGVLKVLEATRIVHHEEIPTGQNAQSDQTMLPSDVSSNAIDVRTFENDWPGWCFVNSKSKAKEVNKYGKKDYVKDYIHWLAYGSVEPQWEAFLHGFRSIPLDFSFLPFQHIRTIVEGTSHFDINDLRSATEYDGYDADSRYIQNFWRLVASWPVTKQKQLLKFVTACERIPAGGASSLTFKIQRSLPDSMDHLPTSSTCFGMLLLPKYDCVATLDKKLTLALKYGLEGFGSG